MKPQNTDDIVAAFEAFIAAKVREMDRAAGIEDAVDMVNARLDLRETISSILGMTVLP